MASQLQRRVTLAPIPEHVIRASGVEDIVDLGNGDILVTFNTKRVNERGVIVKEIVPDVLIMRMDKVCDAIGKAMIVMGRKILARPDGSLTVMH